MVIYLLVFCSTFIADIVWARYISAAAQSRALHAALWSAAIIGLGAFNVTQYAHNWMMVFPALAGAFLGTYVACRKS